MTEAGLTPDQRRRVERARAMVDRMVRGMARRLPRMTEEDLRSVGYEALVKCGLRYDPQTGVPFQAFSYYRVRGAMIDAARRATPAVRRRSRALRALEATQALLEQAQAREHGEGPDPRTLEQRVDAAAHLVAEATAAVMLAHTAAPDPERVADEHTAGPDEVLDDARIREHVRRAIARCSDEEQAMVQALYHEGLSMTELGERMGRNKSTVSRRHAALLRRLSQELQIR